MDDISESVMETASSGEEIKETEMTTIDMGEEAEGSSEKAAVPGLVSESLRKSMESVQTNYFQSIAPLLKQQVMLDSTRTSMLEQQAKISSMVAPALKQQKPLSAVTRPLRDIQADMAFKSMEMISPAIQTHYQHIANALSASFRPILDSYMPLMNDAIINIVSSYQFDFVQRIQLPIQQMLEAIDFSPIYSVFEQLKGFDLSKYKGLFNGIIISETYDTKWFPHALCFDDRDMVAEFWGILGTTRKSKNRIKQIDQLIFSRYDKGRIEGMKKSWRQKNVSSHIYRMMHQAVQAYHRKEYALTVVMLSTLWEGIIYDKANDPRRKSGKRTKEDFCKLISQTDYDALFGSFFDEYIMYDCRSVDDVIEDVPGRNSSAHSWYSKYPSRKAGLNAILFTDFLMKLEPLEE